MGKRFLITIITIILSIACLNADESIEEQTDKKEFSLGINAGAVSGMGLSARWFKSRRGVQVTFGAFGLEEDIVKYERDYIRERELYSFGLQIMTEFKKHKTGRYYWFVGGSCFMASSNISNNYDHYKGDPFSLSDEDRMAILAFGGGVGMEHKIAGKLHFIADVPFTLFAALSDDMIGVIPISLQLGLMYKF